MTWGLDSLVDTETRLRVGRSGGSNPGWSKRLFFHPIRPDRLRGPFSLLFFAGRKVAGSLLTTHLHQAPRLGKSGAIPLLLLHSFMALTRTTLLFTFTLMGKWPTKLYCFCRNRLILIQYGGNVSSVRKIRTKWATSLCKTRILDVSQNRVSVRVKC